MSADGTFDKEIKAITDLWAKHTRKYAEARAKIEAQRQEIARVEAEYDRLEARMIRIRRTWQAEPSKRSAKHVKELQDIARDIAHRRAWILESRKSLQELETQLESIWDVWNQV